MHSQPRDNYPVLHPDTGEIGIVENRSDPNASQLDPDHDNEQLLVCFGYEPDRSWYDYGDVIHAHEALPSHLERALSVIQDKLDHLVDQIRALTTITHVTTILEPRAKDHLSARLTYVQTNLTNLKSNLDLNAEQIRTPPKSPQRTTPTADKGLSR